jgi:anti-sigma factor RsiW
MNHPNQNEWLRYIDGEASSEDAVRLLEHLEQCPMCAAEVAGWKRSVRKFHRMSFPAPGQVPLRRRHQFHRASSFIKWGIAAAIVLFVGFAFGRLSALHTHAFEQTVAGQVREELRRDLRADLMTALDPEREVNDGYQKQLRLIVQSDLARANAYQYRDLMQVVQRQRQQDHEGVLALIKDVREQQITDCLALRQDLETAVSSADNDLKQDSRRISQLANTFLTVQKP